jgi:3-hydroxyisobutyrate dehydrogenase
MDKPQIAFLGLGIMGTGMSRRLLSRGFSVKVWNRNPAKAQALSADGAVASATPLEAVVGAQIVIAMLADDAASRGVWLGETGALAGLNAQTIVVECSTLSVGWVRELANLSREKRCTFVDAPVAGSKAQAAAGELNFFVGADGGVPDSLTPALQAMGKNFTHLGPVGSGAMIKLINNFVCGIQLVAIAEGIALLEQTDLDKEKALAILTNGTPGSPMVKNMTYAIAEGKSHAITMPVAAAALQAMKDAIPKHGEQDIASVVEWYRSKK